MLFASVHWDNIDALSDCFNMALTDILDNHAPLKARIMISRPKIPWFNDHIKQLKRKRRRLEKKALKTENDLTPNVLSIFPLGWSNNSLPVDLRLYNEFDFILIRSLR